MDRNIEVTATDTQEGCSTRASSVLTPRRFISQPYAGGLDRCKALTGKAQGVFQNLAVK